MQIKRIFHAGNHQNLLKNLIHAIISHRYILLTLYDSLERERKENPWNFHHKKPLSVQLAGALNGWLFALIGCLDTPLSRGAVLGASCSRNKATEPLRPLARSFSLNYTVCHHYQ